MNKLTCTELKILQSCVKNKLEDFAMADDLSQKQISRFHVYEQLFDKLEELKTDLKLLDT